MLKQYKTDTFQICGFWQGDKAVLGQMVWVSEAYAKENCYPVTQKELENGIYNGGKGVFCLVQESLESGKENRKYI